MPPAVEPIVVARAPEPVAEPMPPPQPATLPPSWPSTPLPEPAPPISVEPAVRLSPGPSLGSTLLASGILQRPRASAPDPLAPIRRMSQAEKIAFFS
jgi:hypothetical protein